MTDTAAGGNAQSQAMPELRITYDNDAWESFYDDLARYAERGFVVNITLLDRTVIPLELKGIEGDYTSDDPMPYLIGEQWDTKEPYRIALFNSDHTCNVAGLHVR